MLTHIVRATGGDGIADSVGDELTVTLDRWSAGEVGLADILAAASVAVLALLSAWIVRRVARRFGGAEAGVGREVAAGVGRLVSIGIWLFAVALVLEILGFGLGPMVTLLVLAAIAVLFISPIITNMSTGLLLQVRGVFGLGDLIESHDVVGTAEEITSRTVVIHTADGRRVHIPNTDVLNGTITNYTALGGRRSALELRVAASVDLDVLAAAVRRAAITSEQVMRDPAPDVLIERLEGSRLILSVRFWHPPTLDGETAARDTLARAILSEFLADGLHLADALLEVGISGGPPRVRDRTPA
jgi:small-conductance mechanosensitive channel